MSSIEGIAIMMIPAYFQLSTDQKVITIVEIVPKIYLHTLGASNQNYCFC